MIEGNEKAWSAGLPCVQRRNCTEADLELLRRAMTVEGQRLVGGIVLALLLLALVVLLAVYGGLGGAGCFVGSMGSLVSAMVAADGGRRRRMLRRDLAAAQLECFMGRLDALVLTKLQRFALRRSLAWEGGEVSFERLPISGRILRFRGEAVRPWVAFDHATTGAPLAPLAAGFPTLEFSDDDVEGGESRPLAGTERHEITALSKKLRRLGVGPGFLIAYAIFALIQLVRGATPPGTWLAVLLWVGLGVVATKGYVRRRRLRRKLAGDLERAQLLCGTVVVDGRPHTVELLESSKSLWSIDGQPAPWRLEVRKHRGTP